MRKREGMLFGKLWEVYRECGNFVDSEEREGWPQTFTGKYLDIKELLEK